MQTRVRVVGMFLLLAIAVALLHGQRDGGREAPQRPWTDGTLSPDRRADLLLAQMTTEEKLDWGIG